MRGNYRTNADWARFAEPLGFIRLILLVDWDPIGIFGYIGAMDEYDSYAVGIYDLLCSDASQEELIIYLRRIEVERMEVRRNSTMPLSAVAAKLRTAFDTARSNSSD